MHPADRYVPPPCPTEAEAEAVRDEQAATLVALGLAAVWGVYVRPAVIDGRRMFAVYVGRHDDGGHGRAS
jgi:hypothetical protein